MWSMLGRLVLEVARIVWMLAACVSAHYKQWDQASFFMLCMLVFCPPLNLVSDVKTVASED